MEELNLIGQYLPRILQGAVLTLEIAVLSLVISILIGLVGANMRLSRNRLLARLGQLYSSVVRGVPDLIWMLMVYYSAQIGLNALTEAWDLDYFEISPFAAGVLTLSFIFGAYFTETFRGAIMAIPYGQIEAGQAYGMRGLQVMRRITFPLMMRYALPSVRNNWLVLTKATALVSIIGLDDMTRIAQQAGSATHLPFVFNTISALLFLLLTTVSLYVFRFLDRHYQRGFVREDAHV
ncbi:histidine/lysine/arginine/ornithine ABC transporter permease HisQ [Advenella kashmirensis W13003]|uniref:Histidine/lysine/arginine/ornithine ABC transporter permease HisQ n=1 Tax=Advenella kashmirensis W13003 TaxID=1424334 RepID=V8QP99_9BURK|nr:ABC transporter permease [Advenella kashmirensis]ETF01153.1 histidine/lysine/arginine/ornithine ABC transporter permease HisQ [Advenella kashmirensis W13003]